MTISKTTKKHRKERERQHLKLIFSFPNKYFIRYTTAFLYQPLRIAHILTPFRPVNLLIYSLLHFYFSPLLLNWSISPMKTATEYKSPRKWILNHVRALLYDQAKAKVNLCFFLMSYYLFEFAFFPTRLAFVINNFVNLIKSH